MHRHYVHANVLEVLQQEQQVLWVHLGARMLNLAQCHLPHCTSCICTAYDTSNIQHTAICADGAAMYT